MKTKIKKIIANVCLYSIFLNIFFTFSNANSIALAISDTEWTENQEAVITEIQDVINEELPVSDNSTSEEEVNQEWESKETQEDSSEEIEHSSSLEQENEEIWDKENSADDLEEESSEEDKEVIEDDLNEEEQELSSGSVEDIDDLSWEGNELWSGSLDLVDLESWTWSKVEDESSWSWVLNDESEKSWLWEEVEFWLFKQEEKVELDEKDKLSLMEKIEENMDNSDYANDRLIVKFKQWKVFKWKNSIQNVLWKEKIDSIEFKNLDVWVVSFSDENVDIMDEIKKLNSLSDIEYVEPDYRMEINTLGGVVTNDPNSIEQWYLKSIEADKSWKIYNDNESKIITSINDTWIDYNHPDLKANLKDLSFDCKSETWATISWWCPKNWWNFENGTIHVFSEDETYDISWHGTHVAWTVWAVGNNGTGIIWVTQNVEMIWVRADSYDLFWHSFYISDVIKALDFAIQNDAKIVNASYGWAPFSQSHYDSIKRAKDNWILFIASAWNNWDDNDSLPHYPSSYDLDNIISVAAIWSDDSLATYSNYWKTNVDITAPWGQISDYNTWEGWILSTYPYQEVVFEHSLDSLSWITVSWTWSDWYLYSLGSWIHTQTPSYYTWWVDTSLVFNEKFSLSWSTFATISWYVSCDFWSDYYDDNFEDNLSFYLIDTNLSLDNYIHEFFIDSTRYMKMEVSNQNLFKDDLKLKVNFKTDNDSDVWIWCRIDDLKITSHRADKHSYKSIEWTSMAAPVVSWVAAMVWSYKPDLSYSEVKNILLTTVDDLSLQDKIASWWKINAETAIKEVIKRYGITKSWEFESENFDSKLISLNWKNITLSWSTINLSWTWNVIDLQSWANILWTWTINLWIWTNITNWTWTILSISDDFDSYFKDSSWNTISSTWQVVYGEWIYFSYTWGLSWTGIKLKVWDFYDGNLTQNQFIPINSNFSWSLLYEVYKPWSASEWFSDNVKLKILNWTTKNFNFSYSKEYIDVSFSSTWAEVWQDVDMTFKVIGLDWNVNTNYTWSVLVFSESDTWVTFEWELSDNTYVFQNSDNWVKTFTWTKFSSTWTHDIYVYDLDDDSFYWTQDILILPKTIPTWTIDFLSWNITNSKLTTVKLSSSEYPVNYELSWSLVWTYTWTLSSSWNINVELSSGDWNKTVNVKLTDTDLNIWEFSSSIKLDQTSPVVFLSADTSTWTVKKSIEFSLSSNDDDFNSWSIVWSNNLNSNTWTTYSYIVSWETSNNLIVIANFSDLIWNTWSINSSSYKVDNTPPSTPINISFNNGNTVNLSSQNNISISWSWNLSDSWAIVNYIINGSSSWSVSWSWVLNNDSFLIDSINVFSLSDWNLSYEIYFSDLAWNISNSFYWSSFKETKSPTWTIEFLSWELINSTWTTVKLSSSEYPVDYELSWSLVWTYTWTLSSSWNINVELIPGDWDKTIQVRYKDMWNNYSEWYNDVIKLDMISPNITIDSHSNNEQLEWNSIVLAWTITDLNWIDSLTINWSLVLVSSWSWSKSVNLSWWNNIISYSWRDMADNVSTWTINIVRLPKVDKIYSNTKWTGSVNIKFYTDVNSSWEILYGTWENNLNSSVILNSTWTVHSSVISGLDEGVIYFYQVRWIVDSFSWVLSEAKKFKTSKKVNIQDICSHDITLTWSTIFSGSWLTSSWFISSCNWNFKLKSEYSRSSVKLNLDGLIIESDSWDGLFTPPELSTFSGNFSWTWYTHNENLTYNIWHYEKELTLSWYSAQIELDVWSNYSWKNIWVFRSIDGGLTYSYLDTCLVSDSICSFETDKFSLFTLATPSDDEPDSFSFSSISWVELSSEVTSNTIIVNGINTSSTISISWGFYRINSWSWLSSTGTVSNGDIIEIKVTSSSLNWTTIGAILNIWWVTSTFNVITKSVSSRGGGWWWSTNVKTSTCKQEELVCKLVPWSKTFYKFYKKDGVSCNGWGLWKVCSLASWDILEKDEKKEEKISTLKKDFSKQIYPIRLINKSVKFNNDYVDKIFIEYSNEFETFDDELIRLSYISDDIVNLRNSFRKVYKESLNSLSLLEYSLNNNDKHWVKNNLLSFTNYHEELKKYKKLINKDIWKVFTKKLWNYSLRYINYDNKQISKIQNILYDKLSRSKDNIDTYKLSNKLLYILNIIVTDDSLNKTDLKRLKLKWRSIYNDMLVLYKDTPRKKLVVKKQTIKVKKEVSPVLKEEKKLYKIVVHSIKLKKDLDLRYKETILTKSDKLEVLERLDNNLLKVKIVSSDLPSDVWREGYIYEKFIWEIN